MVFRRKKAARPDGFSRAPFPFGLRPERSAGAKSQLEGNKKAKAARPIDIFYYRVS
jgi:hypothetical protein